MGASMPTQFGQVADVLQFFSVGLQVSAVQLSHGQGLLVARASTSPAFRCAGAFLIERRGKQRMQTGAGQHDGHFCLMGGQVKAGSAL